MKAENGGKPPFYVADNYFQELESRMLDRISDEEGEGQLPTAAEGRIPTFKVPAGYFETLEKTISLKVQPARNIFALRWRHAAAAAVTGLLLFSGIYYWRSFYRQPLPGQDTYSAGSAVIRNISVNELADFVEEGPTANSITGDTQNPVDINQLFQQVSSQDLENFLSEKPAPGNEVF